MWNKYARTCIARIRKGNQLPQFLSVSLHSAALGCPINGCIVFIGDCMTAPRARSPYVISSSHVRLVYVGVRRCAAFFFPVSAWRILVSYASRHRLFYEQQHAALPMTQPIKEDVFSQPATPAAATAARAVESIRSERKVLHTHSGRTAVRKQP